MQVDFSNLNDLRIITYPHPILTQVAQPIEQITPEITALAERMTDLMIESSGVGLAAPQVGVSLRLIVVSPNGKRDNVEVLVNPQLSDFQGEFKMEEGCLSIPNIRATVRRYAVCSVSALNLDGNRFITDAVEFAATVYQHETDHLNGILFVDRLNTVSRLACRRSLRQLEQQYEP